jgi:hypothetical protein
MATKILKVLQPFPFNCDHFLMKENIQLACSNVWSKVQKVENCDQVPQ